MNWNTYFMAIAVLASKRSKDPVTQVGACIVKDKKIVATGYNGFPRGCEPDQFTWNKTDLDPLNTKFPYVVHAELNAILNSTEPLKGSILYSTLYPCRECAKAIIQSGITTVMYKEHREDLASKKMFKASGIGVFRYPEETITITLEV